MPGRQYNGGDYRYGFGNQEMDNELKGVGNSLSFKYRIYDPLLGKFLSVDPLSARFAMLTPYQYASNSPIASVDVDGAEGAWYVYAKAGMYGETTAKIVNGTEDGVEASLNATWSFITSDAWKAQTWIEAGLFMEEVILSSSPYSGIYNPSTPRLDAAVQSSEDNVIDGDAYTRSKFVAQATTDIATAYAGSKGLSGLSATAKVAARFNLATQFYKKAGYVGDRAASHMKGINFEKAVQTTTLKKGTVVQQWVGDRGVGNYFTTAENSAKNLAISYEGKTLQQFTLTEDAKVLQSTAAEFEGATGGGTQYFSTELKGKITPVTE